MSWDIYLIDGDDTTVGVDRHEEGGTYAMGGTHEANLNVTYNYSQVTRLVDFHFKKDLDGMVAGDTIKELERVVAKLGTTQSNDYWAPTPGNAGHAVNTLLGWARQHPTAKWAVS